MIPPEDLMSDTRCALHTKSAKNARLTASKKWSLLILTSSLWLPAVNLHAGTPDQAFSLIVAHFADGGDPGNWQSVFTVHSLYANAVVSVQVLKDIGNGATQPVTGILPGTFTVPLGGTTTV